MTTLDQRFISSGVVIHDIIEDYNIQSMDFINRVPTWICQALVDLNVQLQYIDVADTIEFDDYRCQIPDGCKSIRAVIINNHRAVEVDNPKPIEAKVIDRMPLSLAIPADKLGETSVVIDLSRFIVDTKYQYMINGSYLHLNVSNGFLGLLYKKLPFVLDGVLKINVPLIPNDEILRDSIKNFVMMRMLQRGYIHPVLNLKENNPYTNPALAYNQSKIKVRNQLNHLTKDKRDACTRSLLNFFNMKNHYVN